MRRVDVENRHKGDMYIRQIQQTNSQTDSQTKCINFSPLKVDFDMVFIDPNGSPGILNRIFRIFRIFRIPWKRNQRCRTDPGFPTPGVRMTVVYTNSLK